MDMSTKVLNNDQTRELERKAAKDTGSYLELMKNAGMAVAKFILSKFINPKSVAVFCGNGNNGGDGFVVAGILSRYNIDVNIILVKAEPKTEDAVKMFSLAKGNANIHVYDYSKHKDKIKEIIKDSDIIVDAIYGIGFHGKIDEDLVPLIKKISNSNAKVVSVDIPSGVECDKGIVAGEAINADYTVTFSTLKLGHVLYPSADYCGEMVVEEIGINEEIIKKSKYEMLVIDRNFLESSIDKRKKSANKGDFGKLLCVCGKLGMAGAAILSSRAAVKTGVGMVNVVLPKDIYPIVSSNVFEPVFTVLEQSSKGSISAKEKSKVLEMLGISSACLIGCGIGTDLGIERLFYSLVTNATVPLIIDADGINIISKNIDLINEIKVPVILTPHPGEMARLAGITPKEVQENRLEVAKSFAKKHQVTVVLKGANTIVATPGGDTYVNNNGNPGMAKGGSGDVLSGIIASLLAQGMDTTNAAVCGVYIHGRAGDMARNKYSETSMTPTDIINEIHSVFLESGK